MKKTSFLSLASLGVAAIGLSYASHVDAASANKVAICHGTASAKNPYVLIIVGPSAVKGHFDGTAPGHGKNNHPDFKLGEVHNKAEEAAYRKAGNGACTIPDDPGPGPGS